MKASIKEFREKIGEKSCRTMGEYLYLFDRDSWDQEKGRRKSIRARRRGENKGLYDFYPERIMLKDEFFAIWDSQKNFHNDDNIFSEDNKNKIFSIIFYQRPLKPPIVGKCSFINDEERAPRALISFQKSRLWQEINTLKYRNSSEYRFKEIPIENRKNLFEHIFTKGSIKISSIEKFLKKELHENGIVCNYRTQGSKNNFKGNESLKAFKQLEKPLSEQEKDELILKLTETIIDENNKPRTLNDLEIQEWLEEKKFSEKDITHILSGEFENDLPGGYGHLSQKAILAILPHLENGDRYDIACGKILGSHTERVWPSNLSRLPLYNEFVLLQKDCVPRQNNLSDKRIPNPTVHVAMNQLKLVVNDIIDHFGKPEQIVLELARDLPMGAKEKGKHLKRQNDNQKNNERIDKELKKLPKTININGENRIRYKLWEELGKSAHDRVCPYSGKKINPSNLFSSKIEIDHILPYSQTLDDSFGNKTLCIREENRVKGNRSPFEAYGNDNDKYLAILNRVKKTRRAWRFEEDAMEKFKDKGGFLERHLNDTRYISKIAKKYLEPLLEKKINCWVVTGQLTSRFRYYWGCNKILSDSDNIKNRDDHRHHAVDATVIASTSRSMIQKVSSHAKKQSLDKDEIFKKYPIPWPNFREDLKISLKQIVISHKPSRYHEGQIHEDTAYGIISGSNRKGEYLTERRISIENIKEKDIDKDRFDPRLKNDLKKIFQNEKKEENIEKFKAKHNIKKLRIREEKHVFPVGEGKTGFIGGNNWAYDIYQKKDGNWGKCVISTFEIYRHISKKPKHISKKKWLSFYRPWKEDNPDAKLIARMHKNDLFLYSEQVYRVSKIRTDTCLFGKKHNSAFPRDDFSGSDMDKFKSNSFSKINISPAGFFHAMADC